MADKLMLVHPVLADRVRHLFAALKSEGYDFVVTQGMRTWDEQNALYAKRPKVTKAPGGHSQHNFGLAVDVAPEVGTVIDWKLEHPAWQRMLAIAPQFKLAEGRQWPSFPDNPHLYPVEIPATCEILREKYQLGGIQGVWAWFDSLVKPDALAATISS